jgi:hypothetical protein
MEALVGPTAGAQEGALVLRGGTGSELRPLFAIIYIGGFVGALLLRVFSSSPPALEEGVASAGRSPASTAG